MTKGIKQVVFYSTYIHIGEARTQQILKLRFHPITCSYRGGGGTIYSIIHWQFSIAYILAFEVDKNRESKWI